MKKYFALFTGKLEASNDMFVPNFFAIFLSSSIKVGFKLKFWRVLKLIIRYFIISFFYKKSLQFIIISSLKSYLIFSQFGSKLVPNFFIEIQYVKDLENIFFSLKYKYQEHNVNIHPIFAIHCATFIFQTVKHFQSSKAPGKLSEV